MTHKHNVYDTGTHFMIDPIARTITNQTAPKVTVIQGDHRSERFTFEIPRFIDGHDMTLCDKVKVHYINISAKDKDVSSADIYEADDVKVSPDSDAVATFSWLVSGNATVYAGILSFLIEFECLTGSTVDYAWHTGIYSNVTVGEGMNNGEAVLRDYSDALEAWKREGLPEYITRDEPGAVGYDMLSDDVKNTLGNKIDKVTPHWSLPALVAVKPDGTYYILPVDGLRSEYTIPLREAGGVVRVGNAVADTDAVSLGQMNAAIGDISTALDELHNYAQALVNGGAN